MKLQGEGEKVVKMNNINEFIEAWKEQPGVEGSKSVYLQDGSRIICNGYMEYPSAVYLFVYVLEIPVCVAQVKLDSIEDVENE